MSARIDKRRKPRTQFQVARSIKPMLEGLGAALPLDYVFAGADVIYQATVLGWNAPPSWGQRFDTLAQIVSNHYRINKREAEPNSGSIFFNLKIAGDMRSINDIKATMDGAMHVAGYQTRASMVRFLNNPRRDGTVQPPVNTPGVPPPVTQLPPGAGNVNTLPGAGSLGSFGAIFDGLSSTLGISSTALMLGAGLVIIFLLKR